MSPPRIFVESWTSKLEATLDLSRPERDALLALPFLVNEIRADQDIVREGDRPTRCFVVLSGMTCTYRVMGEGQRQIMAFHVAGDMPDLQSLHLATLDNTIATITPSQIAFLPHEPLRHLCADFPRVTAALWRETLIEAGVFRAWMANIGRRQAYGRIAHLFCEIHDKSKAVGLADETTCPFPITQEEIGDALGLSTVHVNRTMQELRAAGLITLAHNVLTVHDRAGLVSAADYDPTYLHLPN